MTASNGSCTCATCGERFYSLAAFDMHRDGKYAQGVEKHTRHCLSADAMRAKGMLQTDKGLWVTGIKTHYNKKRPSAA